MPAIEFLNYGVVDDQGWYVHDGENLDRATELALPEDDYGTLECDTGRILSSVCWLLFPRLCRRKLDPSHEPQVSSPT